LGIGGRPLAVLAGLAVSGALHEDGLADTADGLIGGHDRDQRLAIMSDSRHPSFGVLALVRNALRRAAALAGIGETVHAGLALIAALASHSALPLTMRAAASAACRTVSAPQREGHLSRSRLRPWRSAYCWPWRRRVAWSGALAQRRIGGYTGDLLGAFQQIGENVMLLTAAAR
jgi:adenosylcobinamide-GDP ribazoletransferase